MPYKPRASQEAILARLQAERGEELQELFDKIDGPDGPPVPEFTKEEILAKLAECERQFEAACWRPYEQGAALFTIWSKRLWTYAAKSFEAYVSERWGMSRRWASILIRYARSIERLETIGFKKGDGRELSSHLLPKLTSESKNAVFDAENVRSVASLSPIQKDADFKSAVEQIAAIPDPTPVQVRRIVEKYAPPPPPKRKPKPKPAHQPIDDLRALQGVAELLAELVETVDSGTWTLQHQGQLEGAWQSFRIACKHLKAFAHAAYAASLPNRGH